MKNSTTAQQFNSMVYEKTQLKAHTIIGAC